MKLSPQTQDFVALSGEVGVTWGLSKTSARIVGLLYFEAAPLNAGDISKALQISRSGVSACLKELQSCGLVRRQDIPSHRSEHFSTEAKALDLLVALLKERQRRHIEPLLRSVTTRIEREALHPVSGHGRQRLQDLYEALRFISILIKVLPELQMCQTEQPKILKDALASRIPA